MSLFTLPFDVLMICYNYLENTDCINLLIAFVYYDIDVVINILSQLLNLRFKTIKNLELFNFDINLEINKVSYHDINKIRKLNSIFLPKLQPNNYCGIINKSNVTNEIKKCFNLIMSPINILTSCDSHDEIILQNDPFDCALLNINENTVNLQDKNKTYICILINFFMFKNLHIKIKMHKVINVMKINKICNNDLQNYININNYNQRNNKNYKNKFYDKLHQNFIREIKKYYDYYANYYDNYFNRFTFIDKWYDNDNDYWRDIFFDYELKYYNNNPILSELIENKFVLKPLINYSKKTMKTNLIKKFIRKKNRYMQY